MNLRILTLNCGKAYISGLYDFLAKVLREDTYDFILLQELHTRNLSRVKPHLGNYEILRGEDTEVHTESELAIVYRKGFVLGETKFHSFVHFKKWNLLWPGILGFLMGKFTTPQGEVVVGSIHINPLLHFITRKREVEFAKKMSTRF